MQDDGNTRPAFAGHQGGFEIILALARSRWCWLEFNQIFNDDQSSIIAGEGTARGSSRCCEIEWHSRWERELENETALPSIRIINIRSLPDFYVEVSN